MSNVIITLIAILLFNTVCAQIPTYPECFVAQFRYDESDSGACLVEFGDADLNNKSPGMGQLTKWEYLNQLYVTGNIGLTVASNLNFELVTDGDPNTVVHGKIYGYPMTISNFTFLASSYLVVPKSSYYTFNIATTENYPSQ